MTPFHFDRNVCMRLRDDKLGCYYICTSVYEFKIEAKNPFIWIEQIVSVFLIQENGPRNYYICNDYIYHSAQDFWTYCVHTYVKEPDAHMEGVYGYLPKKSTPMLVTECYPELDVTPLLFIDDHCKFQMLLGILQSMVTIGKPELFQITSSLNYFGACPCEGHLDLAVRCFGYAKTTIHKKIDMNSISMQVNRTTPNITKLVPGYIRWTRAFHQCLVPCYSQHSLWIMTIHMTSRPVIWSLI